jgi:hypothetical protein
VVGLAEWVIKMDDGRRHVLGIASDLPTGSASCTTVSDYHGPGRGAGNSINALMDAWLATEYEKYLTKAIELIRRTIHPADDIAACELNNAELRWSYTVHLQALARFLELTSECGELGEIRDYTAASILHYARWMATNETFYLNKPEQLEYPTETWAAQELRKGNTLLMAARLAEEEEACVFRRRGGEILDEAWRRLLDFDSYRCTRAVAIVLQQGYLETWLKGMEATQSKAVSAGTIDTNVARFGSPATFEYQKQAIRRIARSPLRILGVLRHAAQPSRWWNAARQTWPAERLRRLSEQWR